ncbi:MAG: IS1634 family transposase [Clostridiales bacterium]|jgi:transposase|nr:IS1634 family transposase [Clostridiales bacterium]
MFLKKIPNKKTGRVYLQISYGYRDKDGKAKSKAYQKLGYLDELEKQMDDPIAYYTEYAKTCSAEAEREKTVKVEIRADEQLEKGGGSLKNYGYAALSKIYHELELDRFFNNKRRHERFKFNSESIVRLLAFSRVLYPHSKKHTLELKERFFDGFDFTLDDIYSSLAHLSECAEDAQRHIHEMVAAQYGRDASLIYYDVTNYYFETDRQGGDRKKGYSKEHSTGPIVQMGLAIDSKGIPMAYKTFPGNTVDCETYIPALKQIKKEYGVGRAVVVADKGLNCGDNIVFSSALGDGYVFSQSVRGGSAEFKSYVVSESGYSKPADDGFKVKSRVLPVTAKITAGTTKKGNKSKKSVRLEAQKQVVFFSPKYAKRARAQRAEALEKAADLIANPSKYTKATHYGAAAYVKNLEFDKDSGEIVETGKKLSLDAAMVAEEEKYDGYYAIATSETGESDGRIIEMYRGLWKIEESFKLTKSVLRTRPVYVRRDDHIGGHFLICYIALLLLRLVELRLGGRFPAARIVESMRSANCVRLDRNLYLFHYADEITEAICGAFGTGMDRRVMTLGQIKSCLGGAKKRPPGDKRRRGAAASPGRCG